jgi:hypothetical protein
MAAGRYHYRIYFCHETLETFNAVLPNIRKCLVDRQTRATLASESTSCRTLAAPFPTDSCSGLGQLVEHREA